MGLVNRDVTVVTVDMKGGPATLASRALYIMWSYLTSHLKLLALPIEVIVSTRNESFKSVGSGLMVRSCKSAIASLCVVPFGT